MHPLAEARKKVGMSQVKLAIQLEIDPSIVRHVEAGRQAPYPRFRRRCAEIFGMTEEELFGQSGVKGTGNLVQLTRCKQDLPPDQISQELDRRGS